MKQILIIENFDQPGSGEQIRLTVIGENLYRVGNSVRFPEFSNRGVLKIEEILPDEAGVSVRRAVAVKRLFVYLRERADASRIDGTNVWVLPDRVNHGYR